MSMWDRIRRRFAVATTAPSSAPARSDDAYTEVSLSATDACHLKCTPCPIHYFTDTVPSKHTRPDVLEALLPHIDGKNNLDLTGWGEPLLNPHLYDIIRRAKDAGVASVTVTTAAELLTDDRCRAIVDSGLDSMTVSIDTASPKRYKALKGTDGFDTVIAALRRLVTMKREAATDGGPGRPYMQASFLMLADSLPEMPAFVALMADVGVDEVAFKNVNGVWDAETMQQVVYEDFFPVTVDSPARDRFVAAAFAEGRTRNIPVRIMNDFHARRVGHCFNNAEHRPFVSVTGEVSPCCILAYPVTRYGKGGAPISSPPVSFGNVTETPLPEIWNSPLYREFRVALGGDEEPAACRECLALYSVSYFHDELPTVAP